MSRPNFIPNIPLHWATCPIYAKGVLLPKKDPNEPDSFAEGKSPLGKAWKMNLNAEDSALLIERSPDTFKAIGVFTGQKSKGLVIFDVDRNLAAIRKKWGKDLDKTVKITSPKKNAAKYLFIVPEDLWLEVESLSHTAAGHEGWEVLWGGQGLIAGEYYTGEGNYEIEGDLHQVAQAPEWLLSRMKDQYNSKHKEVDIKYVDNRWSKRTKEEKVAIISSCLSVIKYLGPNQGDYWWEIGAMINNELPGEEGLALWRQWSKNDPDYAYAWENGADPCEARWYAAWRHDGVRLNMGSLIRLADDADPTRKRLEENGVKKLVEETEQIPQRFKEEIIGGTDLLKRYEEIENDPENENPALYDQALHKLAMEAKRKNVAEIEKLGDMNDMYKRTQAQKPKSVTELDDTPFEYLIPGLMPKPWTILLHADGGTGKTAMCQTVAKHIGTGKPFNVHGGLVHVPVGKTLWLNGDQNERVLRRQLEQIGCVKNINVVAEWDMAWYKRFKRMQKKYEYDLVIIDSLDGCNDSNPYEENRREFALPIKKLVRRNGQDFPACSIIIIHHNTKEGKFRGSSAIKNAVDETWNMRKLLPRESAERGLGANSRLLTIEKSREGREDMKMVFTLLPDYTYSITSAPEPAEQVVIDSANQHTLNILKLMREQKKPWSIKELITHETVGGEHRKRAIAYSLNKLSDQKLIEETDGPKVKNNGRPSKYYIAVGESVPKIFSMPRNSVGKPKKTDVVKDNIDNEDCKNSEIVKTTQKGEGFYKQGVFTKPIVNSIPSNNRDESFYKGKEVNRDEAYNFWND